MTTPPTHDDSPPPLETQKTVLFCPDCGHRSPITGDWDVTTTGGERLLVCTDCGSVIDRRSVRRSDSIETPEGLPT
ncbi:hypothetical protein BDK88_2781 [Natrinema hispanicum]|uniref:DUF8106 domain-containing protein n=1 Tax=Natrinema hispanicum TaxID=392421 RepID=A0A482YBU2_9EURY|nr:hypothetical protein [Natrinema hispanicum]RZV08707.1 hypothetical protein BDK88_2781 [Natrinema hispanicum]